MADDTPQTVEIGELTVQYTAASDDAKAEIEEFRDEFDNLVSELSESNAVVEVSIMRDIDGKLAWEAEE